MGLGGFAGKMKAWGGKRGIRSRRHGGLALFMVKGSSPLASAASVDEEGKVEEMG